MRRKSKAELLFLEDLDWLVRDARGLRMLARLMQESGYFDPPHAGAVEQLNFNAGRRHSVHFLFKALVANCPNVILECLDEFSQSSNARRTDPDSGTDASASADSDPDSGT
jgi:hypothetical protein